MAVARSSSGGVEIRYDVLPVLWVALCLPVVGQAKASQLGRLLRVTHQGQQQSGAKSELSVVNDCLVLTSRNGASR